MKLSTTLLSILIFLGFFVNLPAQEDSFESIIGSWTSIDNPTQPSDLFLCNTYRLIIKDTRTGYLEILITSKADENRWMIYHGRTKFSYTVLDDQESNSISIGVQYQGLEFEFEQGALRIEQEAIPQSLREYTSEMEEYLSGSYQEYELNHQGSNNLIVKGFSMIQNSIYANFQNKIRGGRCR